MTVNGFAKWNGNFKRDIFYRDWRQADNDTAKYHVKVANPQSYFRLVSPSTISAVRCQRNHSSMERTLLDGITSSKSSWLILATWPANHTTCFSMLRIRFFCSEKLSVLLRTDINDDWGTCSKPENCGWGSASPSVSFPSFPPPFSPLSLTP